jgi:hypothetical protein
MARKPSAIEAKLTRLTRLVEKGFAAVATDFAHRPTNSEVAAIVENVVRPVLGERLSPITNELRSVRSDLKQLKQSAAASSGLTKEIDHALERIGAVERHLGLKEEIEA